MRIDIRPDVLCLQAANPSFMTGTGTNTYVLFGGQNAVVIDPGPDLPAHRAAIMAALAGQSVAAILVTHAHLDHTEMVPWLAATTGAPAMSFGPTDLRQRSGDQGEGHDPQHRPDVVLQDGARISLGARDITVLHTPGHTAGHLCFDYDDILFSGDHVMGWSTSLVSPQDGDMAAYRRSLHKLLGGGWHMFLAGHGAPILNPEARVQELIAHRRLREEMILAALQGFSGNAMQVAQKIYTDISPALLPAAAQNVLAHLIDLTGRNIVLPRGSIAADTKFDLI